jgi:CTP:molybdopterin cytidylyltransferase MocA
MTATPRGWTAIILAGQRPGSDALALAFGQSFKALVPVGGQPMIARVTATLLNVDQIDRIVILCQSPEAIQAVVPRDRRVTIAASQAGISQSIAQVAGTRAAPWPLFVTTADHPLLTTAMVAAFLAQTYHTDVCVGMVERRVMLAAYPDNQRTWIRLWGGAWSGANLFALNGEAAKAALTLWSNAEQDRKHLWRLFGHFGPLIALRAITRTISLEGGIAALGRRLGLRARAVPMAFAEAAIDVDKLSDYKLAETILERRVAFNPTA